MLRVALALAATSLIGGAAGDAVDITAATWDEKVLKASESGQFTMVKFYAPWCGHCKKLKPDWDKLGAKWNKPGTNALIVDVDCTTDENKDLCSKYGVSGYPTLKYFGPNFAKDGEPYEDERDLKALNKFVKQKSKKPCDPASLENCDKKDTAYLEEIKDLSAEQLKEQRDAIDTEINELDGKHKVEAALFEEQKEVAIATMKRAEELKKELSALRSKKAYKLAILKAKTAGGKEEL